MEADIGLGIIGCGGFGLFALQQFSQSPGIRLAGMAGTARPAAVAAANRFGLENIEPVERLLDRSDVDLVYIATPPFLHYDQARQSLAAGKHVICEKPLALSPDQADELIALARRNDRLVVANLMQRYNPLFDIIGNIIERNLLGALLHGYFENYASDENLPAEHWFWDRTKSGGIFVEHGVHFFDLFAGWLGEGEIVSAQASCRAGTSIEDQVQCAVRYRDGVHVNFYHGFHQPGRLDRQELRLVFEQGDITLSGWIPTYARVHAIADETNMRELSELFPGARIDTLVAYGPKDRNCAGHGRQYDVYQEFELYWGEGRQKSRVYCELLREFMTDQIAWIRNRAHVRRTTEKNGRDSVAMASAADRLAHPK
ncbi:MAG TPA: Gfo/Idh/MocA family oxidoreductase [Lacipirellulaceae bacterium]|jgi:predicted dehydrogenase|nr:Gfo/Idh/MocA family oxidoreductase [Lacipirellulaceae bacterium]